MGKELRKIVMIGPVYPYKTGLSYYVALLYKQLSKKYDVTLLSYSMQYPKILYKKPQKDFEDDVLKIDGVDFILNTASFFSCIKTAKRINSIGPDLVIFQWLHPYFAPCYTIIIKLLKKTSVLFMCHNVFPHERFPLDRALTKITLKNGDYFIVHAQSDAEDLRSLLPNANMKVAVHPAYNFFKQKDMSKEEAKRILGIDNDKKVLLFFGLIREYKGLKHLLKSLAIINNEDSPLSNELKLLIAGDFGSSRDEYDHMIEGLGIGDMVDITDGHIPIGEVEKFFAACDLVVLPYESATQSGVIQVAYSFGKPVLATRVGGLPDVVIDGRTGYVVDPFRPDLIAEAVIDFYENNRAAFFSSGIEGEQYKYSWKKMEDSILELCTLHSI